MTYKERALVIQNVMIKQNMTKAALQRGTGLHINTIRQLLDGAHDITTGTLQAVANALNVSSTELI